MSTTPVARSHRLDEIIGRYGSGPGAPDLEPLRSAGPLTGKGQHPGRIGAIWAVAPLAPAYNDDVDGLTPLLDTWGGETFAWAPRFDPALAPAVDWLTARSTPAVIEIGVIASTIRSYMGLWPRFVAHSLGWTHLWEEYASQRADPTRPDRGHHAVVTTLAILASLARESAGQRAGPALK